MDSIKSRINKATTLISDGKKELQSIEELIQKDGHNLEKMNKEQLLKLIEEKEKVLGKELSEKALHVLMAGRCAGSYGCGVYEDNTSNIPR
jgi:hypothetical protein